MCIVTKNSQKSPDCQLGSFGGGDEIRTHGTVARTHAFQACAFNHSATPPDSSYCRKIHPFRQLLFFPLRTNCCLSVKLLAYYTAMTAKKTHPVISLRNLKKRFGIGDAEHFAIDGIDLTIEKGEFIAIMGPSGCGKTTLLNILGLLDSSIEGEYELEGRSVGSLSKRRQAHIRSEQIGFIFQSFNLVNRLTIIDNVALPLIYKGVSKLARLKQASKMLETFHLSQREFYMPNQLSGGQMQRVAIARALVNNPSIILADEPTGNLDSHASHIIMQELSDLHKKGNTIIMVTHNPNLTTYASRVITMLDGKIDTDTFRLPIKERQSTKKPLSGDAPKKRASRKKKDTQL